ncbi:MAG: winged helix-turn-helix transcriptional regulator [Candidatus Thermoplasmatota archaeon]
MVASRRLLTALLVAFGAFGLLLAGTGAATAQDAKGGLDGTFTIAPSRPGDRAVYALHMVRIEEGEKGGWAYDAGARLEVERMGDRVIPVDGKPQVASSFASTWTTRDIDWGAWIAEWQLEAAMAALEASMDEMPEYGEDMSAQDWEDWGEAMGEWGESLGAIFSGTWGVDRIKGEPWHVAHIDAQDRVVATTRAGSDPDLPGASLAADLGLAPTTTVVTKFGPSTAPCGFHSGLQGTIIQLSHAVQVSGNCPPAGGHFGTAPDNVTSDRYIAVGHDVVQGRPTVVFANEDGADELRLWFAEDTPYPVRMIVPVQVFDDYFVHLLYEMTEFQQGTLQGAQAPAAPLLAPRLVHGPDSTGLEHPFPLAAALEAARVDRENTEVKDWMAAHLDAAIDEARFLRLRDDDNVIQERWTFTLVSGSEALHVTATKGAPYQGPTNTWPGQVPPVPQGTVPPEANSLFDDGVFVEGQAGSSNGRIAVEQMPLTLPRVADLLELWRSDGAGGGVPAWSFQFRPDGSSWIAVGSAEAITTGGGTGEPDAETTLAYSLYGVGPDGSFLFAEESPARYEVPASEDPDAMANADPESDDDWSDPDGFMLASIGYWAFPETKTAATVTAAAGVIGIVAYALLPAKMGALGLFSRIGNSEVLDHPLRAQIATLVEAEPGIHFQELVRRLDAGRGTMEHHLRKLVAANVVSAQATQGFTCYFPKGKVDRHLMAAAPVLKSDGARQVLQCIQEQPGRAAQDVAAVTGLTPSTVNYHLKRLAQSGLVSSARSGRFTLLTPTPLGTQALGAWGRT